MRQTVKFLHTLGAIGLMGAMACFLMLLAYTSSPSRLVEYAATCGVPLRTNSRA